MKWYLFLGFLGIMIYIVLSDFPRYIYIITGIVFVLASLFFLKKVVHEILWIGAIYGLVEWWKYWGASTLGINHLPEGVYIFTATFVAVWIVLRIIFIFSLFPIPYVQPYLRTLSLWINGNKPFV